MEIFDTLKPDNSVTVTIRGPENKKLYEATKTGFHRLDEAINDAVENAGLEINPEDCVFEVTNDTTGVTHKYRLNAHGHLKLII